MVGRGARDAVGGGAPGSLSLLWPRSPGFAAALALSRLLALRVAAPVLYMRVGYTYLNFLVASLFQLLFYSGCVFKDPDKHFAFPDGPVWGAGVVFERPELLAHPWVGLPFLGLGVLTGGCALFWGLRRFGSK